ncbi:MAG: response regulator [Flavobacteriales bacterium]|nr:response regulator [Flavobacteriales bacterium]
MEKLKVILVDDEDLALDVLTNLLSRSAIFIDIVAKCNDVVEAVKKIKELKPDVVFLDVQMPDYAGYEIVNFFEEINFDIIFVTAYDQYAIKAFELSAIDYIVKPVERHRLEEALQKVADKREDKAVKENYQVLLESMRGKELGKVILPELKDGELSRRILHFKDIIAVEALRSYCQIHLKNESPFLVSRNLKYFESLLPDNHSFFRSHRSWILNLDYVKKFFRKSGEVGMENGLIAKVSKNRLSLFEEETSS